MKELMDAGGHSDMRMTLHYQHMAEDTHTQHVNAIGRFPRLILLFGRWGGAKASPPSFFLFASEMTISSLFQAVRLTFSSVMGLKFTISWLQDIGKSVVQQLQVILFIFVGSNVYSSHTFRDFSEDTSDIAHVHTGEKAAKGCRAIRVLPRSDVFQWRDRFTSCSGVAGTHIKSILSQKVNILKTLGNSMESTLIVEGISVIVDGCKLGVSVTDEYSPVCVVAVNVANECVGDEHIPESFDNVRRLL